ncbi:hypothetical protein FE634_22085 [Nocardioides dongxiaopingii]|uniref:hypothetical protein n=1 Tax=Nocardioides sp. S-1144 TaxID=2582905 RepID=UPI0011638861|nr:hypothetical protein [Nocardioides sp. S-1144]QDH11155.1 hypothetical protein FE634_22085 [Nocardioides sp. S-1144]
MDAADVVPGAEPPVVPGVVRTAEPRLRTDAADGAEARATWRRIDSGADAARPARPARPPAAPTRRGSGSEALAVAGRMSSAVPSAVASGWPASTPCRVERRTE